MKVNFESGFCSLSFKKYKFAKEQLHGSFFVLEPFNNQSCTESALLTYVQRRLEWLVYVNIQGIKKRVRNGVVRGVSIGDGDCSLACDSCVLGNYAEPRSQKFDPLEELVKGASKYFLSFIDDDSNWVVT